MKQQVKSLNPLAEKKAIDTIEPSFSVDAWHAMNERDNQLIRDEVVNGYTAKQYVYSFPMKNGNSTSTVSGVSVIGARELAAHYGGIKSKIIAVTDKTGSLFMFKTFEPMDIRVQVIPQLESEPDFYEVVLEVTDIKTGNSQQHRKKETKTAYDKTGKPYTRQHYDVIAESKAFRNGVLSILPQNAIDEFKQRALNAGNGSEIKTIEDYRKGIVATAAKNAIAIDRKSVESLTYAEISGLGQALKGDIETFKQAAEALGILKKPNEQVDLNTGEILQPENEPATYDKGK